MLENLVYDFVVLVVGDKGSEGVAPCAYGDGDARDEGRGVGIEGREGVEEHGPFWVESDGVTECGGYIFEF